MKNLLCLIILFGITQVSLAHEPKAATVTQQKVAALQLFNADQKIAAALKTLTGQGYKLLSVDAVPYRFSFSDEGASTAFVVSAWLGKAETYGWTAQFVTAKVDTDSYAHVSAQIVDHETFTQALSRL